MSLSSDNPDQAELEPYQYQPLPPGCQRFFLLEPFPGDTNEPGNLVRGTFEYGSPESIGPYVAIRHARGYRLFPSAVIVDGKGLLITEALHVFLRNFRRSDKPVRIWTRYLCVEEQNEQERANLWTRPFVESMYEHSTETVDMTENLWDLLDRGVERRVYNAGVNRYKQWDSFPDGIQKTPIPRVSPIWLGTDMPPNPNARQRYRYVPLDPIADEIRLVVIPPSLDPDADLELHVCHEPIRSNVKYTAISYTWGADTDTVDVIVNGQLLAIRKNLRRCLLKLRKQDAPMVFWIDGISINQDEVRERNRQVPRIGDIYWSAVSVVSYLEEDEEVSTIAQKFASRLQAPMMRTNAQGAWEVATEATLGDPLDPEMDLATNCAALYRFITNPYFRRVWVAQELALASNPTIFCSGLWDHSLSTLAHAAYNLYDMMQRDPELVEEMTGILVSLDLDPPDVDKIQYIRKLDYFRHQIRDNSEDLTRTRRGQDSPHFLEAAIFMREFACSVVHDKIFGIWNLAGDRNLLNYTIDYSQAAHEMFSDFSVAWCSANNRLDIIGTSEMSPEDQSGYYANAPSWSTDWGTPAQVSCLVRRDTLPTMFTRAMDYQGGARYMADGNAPQSVDVAEYFSFEGKTLNATAAILDTIVITVPFQDRTFMFEETSQALLEERYTDVGQALSATITGDSITAWPPKAENPENADDENYPWEQFVCRPHRWEDYPNWPDAGNRSRYIHWYGGNYSRSDVQEVREMILRGRELVVTEKGRLALAPDYVKTYMERGPCVLALLASCSVPVVLQESADRPGSYRLLGTCFVQGWMDGEMVLGAVGEGTAREFWQSDRVKKLKII